jgi:hypothetical protein
MKKIMLIALGAIAVAVAFHLRNRSRHSADSSDNGGSPATADDVRRTVDEARDRIQTEAERSS